jgi:hypothetical protein
LAKSAIADQRGNLRADPIELSPQGTCFVGGHVHVIFDTLSTSLPHVRSNELRALGVTSPIRIALLPDIPAVAEVVPGYEADGWQGIAAPANTPTEIIDKLDVPEPVKNVFSALIDPVGFTHDMLRKRLAEGETDASEEMIPGRYEEEILAEGTVK